MLKAELAASGGPQENTKLGTGRSGTGRLRNFKAMNDDKLLRTMTAIRQEGDDDEALDAAESEAVSRGLL
jgi:hypothetical protein